MDTSKNNQISNETLVKEVKTEEIGDTVESQIAEYRKKQQKTFCLYEELKNEATTRYLIVSKYKSIRKPSQDPASPTLIQMPKKKIMTNREKEEEDAKFFFPVLTDSTLQQTKLPDWYK